MFTDEQGSRTRLAHEGATLGLRHRVPVASTFLTAAACTYVITLSIYTRTHSALMRILHSLEWACGFLLNCLSLQRQHCRTQGLRKQVAPQDPIRNARHF